MGATIKLEEYFEFIDSDDIRIKGSRIGIESILYEYIHREQILKQSTFVFQR